MTIKDMGIGQTGIIAEVGGKALCGSIFLIWA